MSAKGHRWIDLTQWIHRRQEGQHSRARALRSSRRSSRLDTTITDASFFPRGLVKTASILVVVSRAHQRSFATLPDDGERSECHDHDAMSEGRVAVHGDRRRGSPYRI